MNEIPFPRVTGTAARVADPAPRERFVHSNPTNLLRDDVSPATSRGPCVAHEGQETDL